jgi:hypothetical protein
LGYFNNLMLLINPYFVTYLRIEQLLQHDRFGHR